jgi:hypothetical protein
VNEREARPSDVGVRAYEGFQQWEVLREIEESLVRANVVNNHDASRNENTQRLFHLKSGVAG